MAEDWGEIMTIFLEKARPMAAIFEPPAALSSAIAAIHELL
jgi:hypothetical protein